MKTLARFHTARFAPVPGERDPGSDDYINDGRFARQLADFLTAGLARRGYGVRRDVVEDWGIWLEIEIASPIAIALCCGNVDDVEHIVFTEPARPQVRRRFRKHDMTAQLSALVGAVDEILRAEDYITGLEWEEPG